MDRSMEVEFTTGQMDRSISDSGSKTRCMARENLYGQMVGGIKVNSKWE